MQWIAIGHSLSLECSAICSAKSPSAKYLNWVGLIQEFSQFVDFSVMSFGLQRLNKDVTVNATPRVNVYYTVIIDSFMFCLFRRSGP